jgi:hypothetical protein
LARHHIGQRATALRVAVAIVIATALGGCGGTSLLRGATVAASSTTRTTAVSTNSGAAGYLAALGIEQRRLASAERQLPHRAPTVRALRRAIALLHTAIVRLADDLAALRPPTPVAALHARLVAAMRLYAERLASAARDTHAASGAPRAANELLSATDSASRSFTAAIAQIDRHLSP